MKRLFWIFTIRRRIKKWLIITVKEEAFFENEKNKGIHSGKPDIDNYLGSRVEMKKEIANVLRSLL